MASRKKNNKSAKKDSMSKKVEVRTEDGVLSRFLGYGLLSLGVLLLVISVALLVLYYSAPRLDENINVPIVTTLPSATNDENIKVKGSVRDEEMVIVYVNDKVVDPKVDVFDGEFEYEYGLGDEGEYLFEVASVSGFPVRKRSEKSSAQRVLVDRTAPSSTVEFTYEKNVSKGAFTLLGEVEGNTTVTLKRGEKVYAARADDNGLLLINDIPVDEGDNRFIVVLSDDAGNERELSNKVVVTSTYAQNGHVNGNGVMDLPESAGELEAAMAFIFANKLMVTFGVVALMLFSLSSGVVVMRLRKESL
jgi:hypothetical protein